VELKPEALDALLGLLREHGVEEFERDDFKVKFFRPGAEADVTENEHYPAEAAPRARATGSWTDPSLWPDGVPPKFPAKKKET
jgi:hypothetical protein